MMTAVQSRLLVNDSVSDPIDRTCGILQGSPLSSSLFNLFIDGLLDMLNTNQLRCLFYADDGVLLTRSFQEAQRLLDLCDEWIKEYHLQFNVSKCAVLQQTDSDPPLVLSETIVPSVSRYIYLGFPITINGIDFQDHLHQRLIKAVKLSQALSFTSDAWSVSDRLHIYYIYLAPMFEYGAPLVSAWLQYSKQTDLRPQIVLWQQLIAWVG